MKKRILIIDDDPSICESLCKVLRSEGYEAESALHPHDFIKKFSARRPDLVLLDLNLPGLSGWDVFAALTSSDPFLPIVIVTGRQNQSQLATDAGAGALMEKPLNVPLLLGTIAHLIAQEPEVHLRRLSGLNRN
ncbi:MAG TPA: response regulator [Verrucomicrobiae bacterium]|jgi:DNA-binding response OmpR family regulator